MRTSDRLADQNNLKGWLDCRAAGHKHKLDWNRAQVVRDAAYVPCRRCPVSIRRLLVTGEVAR